MGYGCEVGCEVGGQERRDVECQEGGGAMVRVVACVGTWGASTVSGTSIVAVCGETSG